MLWLYREREGGKNERGASKRTASYACTAKRKKEESGGCDKAASTKAPYKQKPARLVSSTGQEAHLAAPAAKCHVVAAQTGSDRKSLRNNDEAFRFNGETTACGAEKNGYYPFSVSFSC